MRLTLLTMLLVTSPAWVPAWAPAWAQDPSRRGEASGSTLTLAQKAEQRHPQPVRVGDLIDRQVLEPSQHQAVLGRVAGVAKDAEGLKLVVRYGGLLGFGTRTIAIPVEATALLGQFVQVTDIDPAQLPTLPTWTGTGATNLPNDTVIRVGVNRN